MRFLNLRGQRFALGASRGRIVLQLFLEALVLSLLAAGAGLVLARIGTELGVGIFEAEMEDTPFWLDMNIQPATVLYTMALAVLTAAIVGVVPALQATGRRLQSELRGLGGGTGGIRLGRMWTTLIVAQVAVAVAVLPAVVSTAWSDMSEWASEPTYPAEEFVVADLWTDAEPPAAAPFSERLKELIGRIENEPGVVGVTFRAGLPERGGRIMIEGVSAPATSASPSAWGCPNVEAGS